MTTLDSNIPILPKLIACKLHQAIDPDVSAILNDKHQTPEIDVFNAQPTKEEQTSSDSSDKKTPTLWTFTFIALIIVIVMLLIVIVWYMLKQSDTEVSKNSYDNNVIPQHIINPHMVHPRYQYEHPLHPVNRPQTENLTTDTPPTHTAPSKDDLLNVLNKISLDPIKEEDDGVSEKILKPSKKQESNTKIVEIKTTEPTETIDTNDQTTSDNELAQKFYKKIEHGIDNEEEDDEEDEEDEDNSAKTD
jgi:hypothetical protein